jgi:uncharacterized protein (TIRG00374 family)
MVSAYTRHKRIFIIVKLLIAAVIVTLLVRRISAQELREALWQAEWSWIFCAMLLLTVNLYLQYRRWEILVHRVQPDTPRRRIFSSLLSGITLGFITPGRIGEFSRAFFIREGQWPQLLGLTALDKFYALLVLYFFGLLGILPFLQRHVELLIWMPLMITLLIFFLLLFLLLIHPPFMAAVLRRFEKHWHKRKRVHQLIAGLEVLPSRIAMKLSLLALGQVCTYTIQFYLLVRAFAPVPLVKGLQALTATLWVKTMLPISIGDLGVRESAAIYFLGELGVPPAAAFDGSMLLFIINVLIPAVAGLVFLMRDSTFRKHL